MKSFLVQRQLQTLQYNNAYILLPNVELNSKPFRNLQILQKL